MLSVPDSADYEGPMRWVFPTQKNYFVKDLVRRVKNLGSHEDLKAADGVGGGGRCYPRCPPDVRVLPALSAQHMGQGANCGAQKCSVSPCLCMSCSSDHMSCLLESVEVKDVYAHQSSCQRVPLHVLLANRTSARTEVKDTGASSNLYSGISCVAVNQRPVSQETALRAARAGGGAERLCA